MGTELKTILQINGVDIFADPANLTSMTDLWKAAGSDHAKRPNVWLRSQAATEFIASLASNLKAEIPALTKTRRGGKTPGVWGHWQVALAYLKWVNPNVHQAVNVAFREWYEEHLNPSLKLERGVQKLLDQGYTEEWVETRFKGIVIRKRLTRTLADHNCKHIGRINPFAEVTRSITLAAIGKTPGEHREDKNLSKHAATRDHMSSRDLARIAFLESEASAVIREQAADGNDECVSLVQSICKAAKTAFLGIEAIRPAQSA